jgi:two-component system chemotaxis response regulator CheB
MTGEERYRAVVTGGSSGGVDALITVLSQVPEDFALPVLVVQHLHPSDGGSFAAHLARETALPVIEPCDKEPIEPGRVYTAPANYHMLVEDPGSIALSVDEKVNWSRPSIDVLFESAAVAWGRGVIAVLLSGASTDGTKGLAAIRDAGGVALVQDPDTAETPLMPRSAVLAGEADEIRKPEDLGKRLRDLAKPRAERSGDDG